MKILVINIHSTANAGDAVLLDVTLQKLREFFPGCELILSMNDADGYAGSEPVVSSFTAWFKNSSRHGAQWRCWPLLLAPWLLLQSVLAAAVYRCWQRSFWLAMSLRQRTLVQAYLEADLVVSCPGNFLYSSGLIGIPFLLAIWTITYAWLAGKPVYMMPQTIGPLRRRWEYAVLRWLLPKLRVVLLRDQNSLALCTAAGIHHPRCYLTPDIAFLFAGAAPAAGQMLIAEQGMDPHTQRPLLGVTVINWGAQNRRFTQQMAYEQAVARVIQFFITEYNGACLLFPQVHGPTPAEDDRIPARRVCAQLAQLGARVQVVEREVTPAQLKAAYGQMDLFIGTRLHSNIFALTEIVPVLAIAYQYKTQGIMQMLGLQAWVIDIEKVSEDALIALLQQLWVQRTAVQAELRARIPALQHQAHTILAYVRDDYLALETTGL